MRWRFLLLVFGLSLIVFGGVQEIALWRVARPTPRDLTCEELAARGPGDNVHVRLTDYTLCTDAFVFEERGGRWTVAWLPAVPKGQPCGGEITVLVKMPKAKSMADVVRAADAGVLQGMVVDVIERLGKSEAAVLERSYPGVDFARCRIFELGRAPADWLPVLGSLVFGSLLIAYMLWTLLAGQGAVVTGPVPAAGTVPAQPLPSPPLAGSNRARP